MEPLLIDILDNGGREYRQNVKACADTGCTTTVFHSELVPPVDLLFMEPDEETRIVGWNGQKRPIMGRTTVNVRLCDTKEVYKLDVIVTDDVRESSVERTSCVNEKDFT